MCHVLIIEDEVLVAFDIQFTLADAGATSFAFAATEAEAQARARANRPKVITSDVRLAADGHGPTVVAAIHAEHGFIPVLFITGSPEECVGCPSHLVLPKPLNPAQVAEVFRRLAPS